MKGKYKQGAVITSWQDFIETVKRDKVFYFHGDLTQTQVVMGWQLSTVLRYCDMPNTLRKAIEQK